MLKQTFAFKPRVDAAQHVQYALLTHENAILQTVRLYYMLLCITVYFIVLHYMLIRETDLGLGADAAFASDGVAAGLQDAELAEALERIACQAKTVVLVADKVRVAVAVQDSPDGQWVVSASGDLGDASRRQVEAAPKKFKWIEVASLEQGLALVEDANAYSKRAVKLWGERRDEITGFRKAGRHAEIPDRVRKEVGAQAGWHCQFEGCGENLWSHASTKTAGNFSYFAHIVASSADGPRGDDALSAALSTQAENVMLLCDKCHRLIDRVSPSEYSAETLRAMRAANIAQVERLFGSLRYPSSDMIVIGGNIAGQTVQFDQRRAEDAMRGQKLRPWRSMAHGFAYNGNELGDGTASHYWESLFDQFARTDIALLQSRLMGSTQAGARADVISVFPLHLMSVLALAGRLIGEARSVELFQFERNAVGGEPGGQWAWPANAEKPDVNKYSVTVHRPPASDVKEALLLVSLTDRVPPEELPPEFYKDGVSMAVSFRAFRAASYIGVAARGEQSS